MSCMSFVQPAAPVVQVAIPPILGRLLSPPPVRQGQCRPAGPCARAGATPLLPLSHPAASAPAKVCAVASDAEPIRLLGGREQRPWSVLGKIQQQRSPLGAAWSPSPYQGRRAAVGCCRGEPGSPARGGLVDVPSPSAAGAALLVF
jgi:hypothetical protein